MLSKLLDILFPPRPDEKIVRNIDDGILAGLVSPILFPGEEDVRALLPFHDPRVRGLIHEAKYHGSEKAFRLLGNVLDEYLLESSAEDSFGKAVLLPIPLSKERLASRGFNQVEEVVRRAGMLAGLEIQRDILLRVKDTASQTTLSREARRENMKDAFKTKVQLDPLLTYIVVDDVVTTGATLHAAVEALRAGGAKSIFAVALAH